MDKKVDLLIIGNGVAGNSAALAARRENAEMSIMMLSGERYPQYSAPALPDYLSGELSKEQILVNHFEDYIKNGIELCTGDEAVNIDGKSVILRSGARIDFDKLILSTGSSPVQLRRMKGTSLPGNFVLKTIDDVDSILSYPGKRAVVVGSGAIGLEGGMALKERGYEQVTIVEALDWISMKSFDKVTAEAVVKTLNDNGIEVIQGEGVAQVEGDERVQCVRTCKRMIPCDVVLWGIGMRPNVELAKQAGVKLGELGGILVDEHMRTSIPDIYACGDCVETKDMISGRQALNLFWEPAARSGMVAGCNCAGGQSEFSGSLAVFLTYIGDTPVVAFGKTEKDLEEGSFRTLEFENAGRLRRIIIGNDDKILGVQMVGTLENVNELLDQYKKNMPIDRKLSQGGAAGRYPAMQLSLAKYIEQMECAVSR